MFRLSEAMTETWNTYLLFLLVEIIYDDTNEQVQSEEWPKDDEDDKINIHVEATAIHKWAACLPMELTKS